MANVCVSDDFRIEDGKLGLANVPASGAWLQPVEAVNHPEGRYADTNYEPYGRLTTLPGKRICYAGARVVNTYGIPITVMVRAQRPGLQIRLSNPNAVQVRAKWSYVITDAPTGDLSDLAQYPDPSQDFDLQVGMSLDAGASSGGVPVRGVLLRLFPPSNVEDVVPTRIMPGQHLYVRFAAYLWTPPPWSDNANNNNPIHSYAVLGRPLIDVFRVADVGLEVAV